MRLKKEEATLAGVKGSSYSLKSNKNKGRVKNYSDKLSGKFFQNRIVLFK